MAEDIAILSMSGEGCGLTILGRQASADIWQFRSPVNDHTPTLLWEDDGDPDPAILEETRWLRSLQ